MEKHRFSAGLSNFIHKGESTCPGGCTFTLLERCLLRGENIVLVVEGGESQIRESLCTGHRVPKRIFEGDSGGKGSYSSGYGRSSGKGAMGRIDRGAARTSWRIYSALCLLLGVFLGSRSARADDDTHKVIKVQL